MRRFVSVLLIFVLLTGFALAEGARTFTDSCGREVILPEQIRRVAVTGDMAQIMVFAIAPDMLAGTAGKWHGDAKGIIPDEYLSLPVLGQLYGGKGGMNPESLLAADVDLVIDIGENKKGMAEDLDSISAQIGIPFAHIDAELDTYGAAFRTLGGLLGRTDDGERLAAYCEDVVARVRAVADTVEKKNILYITGDAGLNVIARGSYHAEVIDMLCNNLAVVGDPSSKGTGNEVDMEQMLNWSPDYIVFSKNSIYETVADRPEWQTIPAIRNGAYAEAPDCVYNWMGFPPGCQRLMGMLWLAKTLYPDAADYDLFEETSAFYQLFCHCDLTEEAYRRMTENSMLKAAAG